MKNEHFKYVRSFYLEKPQHYLTLYGISDILSIAVNHELFNFLFFFL
jgi:hypothetical protein